MTTPDVLAPTLRTSAPVTLRIFIVCCQRCSVASTVASLLLHQQAGEHDQIDVDRAGLDSETTLALSFEQALMTDETMDDPGDLLAGVAVSELQQELQSATSMTGKEGNSSPPCRLCRPLSSDILGRRCRESSESLTVPKAGCEPKYFTT